VLTYDVDSYTRSLTRRVVRRDAGGIDRARGAGVEENQRVAAAAGSAVERHDDALADALATHRGIAGGRLRSAINARRRDA
jgi:hypothetical protein